MRVGQRSAGNDTRRPRAGLRLAPWIVLGLVVPSPAWPGDDASPGLSVDAVRDRIAGNTVEGTTNDGPYTLFFAPDGRLVSVDRDGRVEGTWALRDGRLCTALADEDEECRIVEMSGSSGAFRDSDGSRYPFTIAPGDPKGL